MTDLQRLQAEVGEWNRVTYPDDLYSLQEIGLKLAEEAGEVCKELLGVDDGDTFNGWLDRLQNECADVLIVLLALAERTTFDLWEAVENRFSTDVSKRRTT